MLLIISFAQCCSYNRLNTQQNLYANLRVKILIGINTYSLIKIKCYSKILPETVYLNALAEDLYSTLLTMK